MLSQVTSWVDSNLPDFSSLNNLPKAQCPIRGTPLGWKVLNHILNKGCWGGNYHPIYTFLVKSGSCLSSKGNPPKNPEMGSVQDIQQNPDASITPSCSSLKMLILSPFQDLCFHKSLCKQFFSVKVRSLLPVLSPRATSTVRSAFPCRLS